MNERPLGRGAGAGGTGSESVSGAGGVLSAGVAKGDVPFLWLLVSVFLFGSRAPIRGIKGQQRQRRKEDRADERPPRVCAKGEGMFQGLFDAVPSDEPAEDRRDAEVSDQRPRPD